MVKPNVVLSRTNKVYAIIYSTNPFVGRYLQNSSKYRKFKSCTERTLISDIGTLIRTRNFKPGKQVRSIKKVATYAEFYFVHFDPKMPNMLALYAKLCTIFDGPLKFEHGRIRSESEKRKKRVFFK